MVGRWWVGFVLVGLALLAAGCGAIEDLEDDLSTITIPEVTIPDITLPDVTLPDLTLPDVTLPDVTLPELTTTTTVLEQTTTTAPAPSSTTSMVAITTTQPPAPATTSPALTTSTTRAPTTTTTKPPITSTPSTMTTVADTTTRPSTTSTVVEAAPSTTFPGEDEGGSALPWALAVAAVIGAGIAAWAIDRARKEAGELAARQAEWDDRIRGAHIRGRWVLDQFDDLLSTERSVDADPRGLRAGVETVVEDLFRLETDAVNVDTRAMIRELSDAIRGLDRATDVAAGLLAGGDEQPSVEMARGRLDAVLERLASTIQPDTSPPV